MVFTLTLNSLLESLALEILSKTVKPPSVRRMRLCGTIGVRPSFLSPAQHAREHYRNSFYSDPKLPKSLLLEIYFQCLVHLLITLSEDIGGQVSKTNKNSLEILIVLQASLISA